MQLPVPSQGGPRGEGSSPTARIKELLSPQPRSCRDLTLSPHSATLCGYTQADLETTFAEHLAGVDWARLRQWYNGYRFLGEAVYNPYDVLRFIEEDFSFRSYWFETGSPSFLIELFQARRYFLPDLENLEVDEQILDAFDVERINPVTLLYQAGYLTIASTHTHHERLLFCLTVPNKEVRLALNDQLITGYTALEEHRIRLQDGLYDALIQGDLPCLIKTLRRVFAAIPWRHFTQNDLAEAEGYYASVLYAFFASLNAEITPEDITNHGQVDLTIRLGGYTYVVEIKVHRGKATPNAAGTNPALEQIQQRRYSETYRAEPGRGLFELGLVFDAAARNLMQADWRQVGP